MTKNPAMDFGTDNISDVMPILPLFDVVLFPKMVLPLVVMQAESVKLIDEAMSKDRVIGLLVSKESPQKDVEPEKDLYTYGTSALILKMAKTEDDKAQLLVQGLERFKVKKFINGNDYLTAQVAHLKDIRAKDKETEALMANITSQFARVVELSPGLPQEIIAMAKSLQEPGVVADMIASTINATAVEKQKVLQILDVKKRLTEATRLVNHQREILELGSKIQNQVKGDMDKRQREYYLRQQLKAIKEELGETDDSNVEVEDYRAKIEAKNLPDEAKKEAERELDRLSRMHPSSSEYTVASTYLDWLTALPWHERTEDNLDIQTARNVLDEDHFGLEKAKKRILEYIAVRKLKPDS
ncbi:MAG: LON peptidase substrate-binding domain-containing protein, partial [Deltaproteobacteria bacterium]|nr:LON peptidase substrate-binding domain-containing protein [Deltaproteobacteria bacterium]